VYPFERLTERAKKVLTLAQEQAERSHHSYIGNEPDFFMSAPEAKEYGIIHDIIVPSSRDGRPAARGGGLELASAAGGKPEPRPEPEHEGPKTSP